MGRISSGVGLISGINSKDIIDQLMALEARPKDRLRTRIEETNQQKLAYTDLSTRLTSLKLTGTRLKKPSTFEAAQTSSSNEDILSASATNGAAEGSYQFQVARLVTSQQLVSRGFTDIANVAVGAGTITLEQGGGEVSSQTLLSQLNGGAGVRRGVFRITDRAGSTAVVDISSAVSADDVVKKINTSLDVSVRASISGDKLVLSDTTGKTTSALKVEDLLEGHAAADLGLTTDSDGDANTITGGDINFLGRDLKLGELNDGRGIRKLDSGTSFTITASDGTAVNVALVTAQSLGDAVDAINTAGAGKVKAEFTAGGNGIKLTDTSGGGGTFSVVDATGSKAAADLGIATADAGGAVVNGSDILAGINTVLIASLNGGAGLTLGEISIQDRDGDSATVDLAGAKNVQEILDRISNATGVAVTAKLKASGNGIEIVDDSGGTGNIIIDGGVTSTALGINGIFDTSITSIVGKNLQRQWVTENTLLSTYNGGKGVALGKIKIANTNGVSTEIDLSQSNATNLGEIITQINSRAAGVTASINATGDGLLLTDATTGALKLTVEDVEGTTAKDLGILGTAKEETPKLLDGSMEKTIEITATDKLADVQKKINDLSFGVTANILNDGSGTSPFRMSLNARNSGRAGRVVFDAGATTLGTNNLVEARDAAVFVGGAGAEQPLLVTSSQNQMTGVIKGVTIDLHGVSDQPVTLNITRTADTVIEQLTSFTENFNEMVDKIKELTKFDVDTKERGLLLGETSIQKIESEIYAMLQGVVSGNARYRILADVGIRVVTDAKIEFDEEKFRAAFADDPDAVKALFTTPEQGLSSRTLLGQLNEGKGIRVADSGNDFSVTLRDGTKLDVSLAGSETLGDILSSINTADNTKLKAELQPNGSVKLSDLTAGAGEFVITPANGSQALDDLKLPGTGSAGIITGLTLGRIADTRARGGGLGYIFENRISHLIDPVSGIITRENRSLDQKTTQFQGRIDQLDKLIQSKRERLERQFAQMETVLSSLQNQQQAIGQIQTIQLPSKR